VINEAALLTVREGKPDIETPELEEAIQRVLSGPKRRGRVLSAEERTRAAYHESGHVIVAAAAGRFDEVHRVSILARARSLGAATIAGDADAALLTESGARSTLTTYMAGIAAEMLVFDEASSGGEQDIEQATALARDIVGRYGMSSKIGRVRLLEKAADVFLGSDPGLTQVSGVVHQAFDEEVRRLLDDAELRATSLLTSHRRVLDTLASRLEVEETIEGHALEAVLTLVRPEVAGFGESIDSAPSPNGRAPKTRAVR
jgi:cell division protease FtsH